MACSCSPKTKCYSAFGVGIAFFTFGLFLTVCWPAFYNSLFKSQLSLNTDSRTYDMWKETPIPMYLDIYMFNWTNAQDVHEDWKVKPRMQQLGPYVFSEKHVRVNMTWNNNDTITFQQVRTWHFEPDMSDGTLEDEITNLNVIAATIGYLVRHKNFLLQRGMHYFMKEENEKLYTTKTVRQLLFEGYDDKLLNLVKSLNISGFNVPFSKFGWFVGRNESPTYDGVFNMFTGADNMNKIGVVDRWNGYARTPYYPDHCGDIIGTTGELWPPVNENETIYLFSSDLCSSVSINHTDSTDIQGVRGKHFIGTDNAFDNGEKYIENKCYNVGDSMPTGVRNVSDCRFGAPAFISFPHFYLADESYVNAIGGMEPNKTEHELYVVIEPKTGIPLAVRARVQINILIQPIPGIDMYKNTNKTLFPMFWFVQRAQLTEEFASQVKLLLTLENLGLYTGYGLTGIGLLLLLISLFITFQRTWKKNEGSQEK